jgi:hypothetical protein
MQSRPETIRGALVLNFRTILPLTRQIADISSVLCCAAVKPGDLERRGYNVCSANDNGLCPVCNQIRDPGNLRTKETQKWLMMSEKQSTDG